MKKPNTLTERGGGTTAGSGMTLNRLLVLQVVYCLMGVGYNVVSLIIAHMGGAPLSATRPVTGMIVMLAYGACLIVGALRYVRIYRVLMALSVLVFGYGGVIVHIMNYAAGRSFLYSSTTAWAIAIAINLFGLALNLVAALGLFSYERK